MKNISYDKTIVMACLSFAALFSSPILSKAKPGFLLVLKAGMAMPLGTYNGVFKAGPSLGFYGMKSFLWKNLYIDSDLSFSQHTPTSDEASSLNILGINAGSIYKLPLTRYFQPYVGLGGGFQFFSLSAAKLNDSATAFKGVLKARAGFMSAITPSVLLRIGGDYGISKVSGSNFQHIQAGLTVMLNTGTLFSGGSGKSLGRKESLVQISDVKLNPIFGARYSTYKEKGIGTVTIENVGRNAMKNIRVETSIEGITDKATRSKNIPRLEAGAKIDVTIPVAINSEILNILEDRDLPISFRVIYRNKRGLFSYVESETILVHSKNSLTWDDTKHLGSFITPHEKVVSTYAKKVIAKYAPNGRTGTPKKLMEAALLYDSLGGYGISYVSDPQSGFAASTKKKLTIDYVMFARETLHKKAGDCDDLTVLYASTLEAVGIKTAIVTVPGHVLLMFDTEIPERQYSQISPDKKLVYIKNGTVWVPVEVTMLGKNFIDAWKNAAGDMAKYADTKDTKVFDITESYTAWRSFPPADIGPGDNVAIPSSESVNKLFAMDREAFKTIAYDDRLQLLMAKVTKKPTDYKSWNKIGILYARFGNIKKAKETFNKIISNKKDFTPAYINLGNVGMLEKDFTTAADYFEKALIYAPKNVRIRLSLARVYFELNKRYKAKREYEKALKNNPAYAKRYAYLGGATDARAADPGERLGYNLWE